MAVSVKALVATDYSYRAGSHLWISSRRRAAPHPLGTTQGRRCHSTHRPVEAARSPAVGRGKFSGVRGRSPPPCICGIAPPDGGSLTHI